MDNDNSVRCIQMLASAKVNYLSDNFQKIIYMQHIQKDPNVDHQKLLLSQRSKATAMELIKKHMKADTPSNFQFRKNHSQI